MERLPAGNCPFCDAERGVTSAWGMSPEGWGHMKDAHDNGHPNYKKNTEVYALMFPKCKTPDGCHGWKRSWTTGCRYYCEICGIKN